MKIKKPLFVLILLVLCLSSATSSFAIDVKIDFDRTTDFGRYKTFCWQKVGTRNPLWIERIRAAVGSALTAKGWSQAESGSACDILSSPRHPSLRLPPARRVATSGLRHAQSRTLGAVYENVQ